MVWVWVERGELSFIMLNSRLQKWLPLTNKLWKRVFAGLSQYTVREVRGDYLYVLQDDRQQLQYMREVETEDGRTGIVLKIQQLSTTYVAMYHTIPKAQQSSFALKQQNIPWQTSVDQIRQAVNANQRGVFDVTGKSVPGVVGKSGGGSGRGEREQCLVSLWPLLDVCYDLQYGGLFHFTGCRGSRKTSTLATILHQYNNRHNHIGVYFNAASQIQAARAAEAGSVVLGGQGRQRQTDVGVFMLALKAIHLAKALRKDGRQVLVGLDNFKQVLQAQWHMLQLLSNTTLRKSGQLINYSAPKIAPISLLNQLYAGCGRGEGSLTGVVVTEGRGKDEQLMPQVTPYSNNMKHLASLSQAVQFPVGVRHNYRTTHLQVDPYTPQPLPLLVRAIRQHINNYMREKQESDLKRKLYRSDMRESPWDYYMMLDAEWWLQGLQRARMNSEEEERLYLQWLLINIEGELIPHWKIPCNDAYAHFANYLQRQGVPLTGEAVEGFVGWAKLQGIFSPFKKDYLH